MRKLFTILLLLAFTCTQAQLVLGVTTAGSAITTGIDYTKILIFEGDSYPAGYNVTAPQKYTTLFVAGKGGTEDNNAVNGEGVQDGGSLCSSFVEWNETGTPAWNGSIHGGVIISLGTNDILRDDGSYTVAQFKTDFKAKVQYLKTTRSVPADKILIFSTWRLYNYNLPAICGGVNPSGARIAAYNVACQEVASEEGCIFFDIYTAMAGFVVGDYQVDQIHLNATGHLKLANLLLANLNDLRWFVLLILLPMLILRRRMVVRVEPKKRAKVISIYQKKHNKAA